MPKILATKQLKTSQKNLLIQAGCSLVEYNSIKINFSTEPNIPLISKNAILTSKNAFYAIRDKTRIDQVFCVGKTLKVLLEKANIPIKVEEVNAKNLAAHLIENHSDLKFDFFCGNKRRPELPEALKNNDLDFSEYEVYQTHLNPKKFEMDFDGILFFSPSAVRSFVEVNRPGSSTAFCIGSTTAAKAKEYFKTVQIANTTRIESVIAKAVHFLST